MARPTLIVVLSLLAGQVRPAAGQLQVNGLRNLTFGNLTRGIPKYVPPSDPAISGEFDIITAIGNSVRIVFTLPTQLNGPAGATLPISFGNSDAIAISTRPNSTPVTFDPKKAKNLNNFNSTRYLIFLGGTASPAANQQVGNYTGTVTMTVTLR